MTQLDIASLAGGACIAGGWVTSVLASRTVAANRRDEDRNAAIEDEYPGPRRSLHYTRQDVSAVFVALIVTNALLAAILAVLVLHR